MDNVEKSLEFLNSVVPDSFKEAMLNCIDIKLVDFDYTQVGISKFIATEAITADCEILERLQNEFLNINFIFTTDRQVTPFLHLFKNDNEGVALYLKHDAEFLSDEEAEEINLFTIDERIEILVTAIKSRLTKIGATKDNKYIICYGGSDVWKDIHGEPRRSKLVHRLSILEIKY